MSDITTPLITGVFSIITVITTLLLKNYFGKAKYKKADAAIRDATNGMWQGAFQQLLGSNYKIDIQMDLKVASGGAIKGKAYYSLENQITQVELEGGYYSQRFLKLNYENDKKAVLQFGSFVLKLSEDSRKLEGNYIGFGPISKQIIGGSIELQRS